MSGSQLSPETLINQALDKIRYPISIGSIYEGSKAANIGLRLYGQTRDSLLRTGDWPFARQPQTLTLLKTAPPSGYGIGGWTSVYPASPWVFEYAYPTNCLNLLAVRPTPVVLPVTNPFYSRFAIGSDPTQPSGKVVLTNLGPNAQAVIAAKITDPTQWEASFIDAFVDRLATELEQALNGDLGQVKARDEQAAMAERAAETRRG